MMKTASYAVGNWLEMRGTAFRILPADGAAGFPRTVEYEAGRLRGKVTVPDSSWYHVPFTRLKVDSSVSENWTVQMAETDADIMAPASPRPTTVLLSAPGGDVLPAITPADNEPMGYALSPNMLALRIWLSDDAQSRTVTKWVQNSAGIWRPAAQLVSTARAVGLGETVFDQYVIVGSGRLYLQVDDGLGALSAEVTATVLQ